MDLQLSGERLPQLADVVPQGIQHEFHRDLLQASSPESCQSHVLLDDPESAFDLAASVHPQLYPLPGEQQVSCLLAHHTVSDVDLEGSAVRVLVLPESAAVGHECAAGAARDGEQDPSAGRPGLPGDRASGSPAQASYPVRRNGLVDRRSGPADLPLPVLVFDIRLNPVFPAVSVKPGKPVSCIGDQPFGGTSVKTSVFPQNRHCRICVVSVLVYEVFRDYPAADDELYLVGGMPVPSGTGIVVLFQAHRRGIVVRLVVRVSVRAADALLLLVFQRLFQIGAEAEVHAVGSGAGLALLSRFVRHVYPAACQDLLGLSDIFAYFLGSERLASGTAGIDAEFGKERDGLPVQPFMEPCRLPDELVFVRIGFELGPVQEGCPCICSADREDCRSDAVEDLVPAREHECVHEVADRRESRLLPFHDVQESQVVLEEAVDFPQGGPFKAEGIEDGSKEPIGIEGKTASGRGTHFYVFSYDPFKSGRVQETEKGIDFSLLRWVDVKIGAQSLL